MKRAIVGTIWTAVVAIVASLATIILSPLLADVPPFNRLIYFQTVKSARPAPVAGDRYRYMMYMGKIPVRIDNGSGDADLLTAGGWRRMDAAKTPAAAWTPPDGDVISPPLPPTAR